MKYLINFTLLIGVLIYPETATANQCSVSNYNTEYVGDSIPVGDEKTGETLGQINVSFNYSCTFTNAHTIKLFGTWGQQSYISGKTYKSNLDGIQLVTPHLIGTSGPHYNSVIFASLSGNTSGTVSGPLFYVNKVSKVTYSGDSVYLGTSHDTHYLQYDVFKPGASYGTVLEDHLGFADISISRPTCRFDTNDVTQTVTLPTVAPRDFTGVGSTTGPSHFSIKLNCDAKVTLSANMTDANFTANVSDALTLNSNSTASGVGIQVFLDNKSTPVTYGVNKWYIDGSASAAATTYTIPFLAKYVQTKSTIGPGSVYAQAIISFFYE
ncbi:fimbrial protein [Vibrio algarum]|uniref:Fimbrial protein n=1 Tax=Vibrio algarum TaxID=3020714 RepID=A0ABT4YS21_9VIBR|nr:fimbrial protein [Vibrio sp. KJ40-1]MDB1124355.1 fimbrial protein [Vibrio sp. KJ40-1]